MSQGFKLMLEKDFDTWQAQGNQLFYALIIELMVFFIFMENKMPKNASSVMCYG